MQDKILRALLIFNKIQTYLSMGALDKATFISVFHVFLRIFTSIITNLRTAFSSVCHTMSLGNVLFVTLLYICHGIGHRVGAENRIDWAKSPQTWLILSQETNRFNKDIYFTIGLLKRIGIVIAFMPHVPKQD